MAQSEESGLGPGLFEIKMEELDLPLDIVKYEVPSEDEASNGDHTSVPACKTEPGPSWIKVEQLDPSDRSNLTHTHTVKTVATEPRDEVYLEIEIEDSALPPYHRRLELDVDMGTRRPRRRTGFVFSTAQQIERR